MPFPVLTLAAQGQCVHGGKATFAATGAKVLIDNAPTLVSGDTVVIALCAFTVPSGKPQPCVKGVTTMPASKLMIGGAPAVLQGPGDTTQSAEQIPGGPLVYAGVQTKVLAT